MLGVIPATLCSAERSFSVLHRLKTYLRSTMGNNVSVTSHLLTNSVVNNDMDRIIDIFGSQNGKDSYF